MCFVRIRAIAFDMFFLCFLKLRLLVFDGSESQEAHHYGKQRSLSLEKPNGWTKMKIERSQIHQDLRQTSNNRCTANIADLKPPKVLHHYQN